MEARTTSNPEQLPAKKPSEKGEVQVAKNVEVVAQWSALSVKIFELEAKLRKARQLKENLEKDHPKLLSQLKGLVRKDHREDPGSKMEEEKAAPGKKETDRAERKKRKAEEGLKKVPESVKKSLNTKLSEQTSRNTPQYNLDFNPTYRELDKKNIDDSSASVDLE